MLALAHGVAPGTVSDALGMVNRFMPGSNSTDKERHTGKQSGSAISDSILTKLGRNAADDLHQNPEKRPTGTDAASPGPEALLAD
jgi:hypothetical protein